MEIKEVLPKEFLTDIEEYKRLTAVIEDAEAKVTAIKNKFQEWLVDNQETKITIADRIVQLKTRTKVEYDEEGIKPVLEAKGLWHLILAPEWKKLNNLIKGKFIKEEEIVEFISMVDGTPYIAISEFKTKKEVK